MRKRKNQFETREQYLLAAARQMDRDLLANETKHRLPETFFVSVMEPAGKVIGRAWPASHDSHHIFVSASLHEAAAPYGVLATLLHEMCHIAVGTDHKHDATFKACARAVGLEGKATATYAGEELLRYLERLDEALAGYPHKPLEAKVKHKQAGPGVRQKYVSVNDESYSLYISTARVEEWGPPKDPAGDDMEPA